MPLPRDLPLGPVMVDLAGPTMSAEEREVLLHPAVGGVILFARNFAAPEKVVELVGAIHALRHPRLLVAVDQEGGRVQRFREGFTRLPPAGAFGAVYDQDPRRARALAEAGGWLMAAELRAVGVDLSFAPVLDLDYGVSRVIGNRAFHASPDAVTSLAHAFIGGMEAAGMAATGKHFPGHGAVAPDSHQMLPVDGRPLTAIEGLDLVPYRRLAGGRLAAVMAAHVVYSQVDQRPAGFSRLWLRDVLRGRLGFQGAVLSDDLSMAGAAVAGGPLERARAALGAGCDMALVCNAPEAAAAVLEGLERHGPAPDPVSHLRLLRLHGRPAPDGRHLRRQSRWREAVALVEGAVGEGRFELEE
jgi:beta-N-acetylhexosaminidase